MVLALNKPGEDGAVHVVTELPEPPGPVVGSRPAARADGGGLVPHLHHPTGPEMETALNARAGWMTSARRVPPVELR
nr:hypothetical protein StreXyl84_00030 [Streptomyces sp. Xyl84]BFD87000.1 hypothetical protein StreXyl84_64010 [Streptomyces sp. Xyl84]